MNKIAKLLALGLLLACTIVLEVGAHAADLRPPDRRPLVFERPVRDKNFYFLHLLESSEPSEVRSDLALSNIARAYRARLTDAQRTCVFRPACYLAAAELTPQEIETASARLRGLSSKAATLRAAIESLRRSGVMIRSATATDADLAESSWRESANSLNRILATYGKGIAPATGAIDAMTLDSNSDRFGALLRAANRVVLSSDPSDRLFYSDALEFGYLVLEANGRDEAGRLEPLESGENRLAWETVSTTDWRKYRYSTILVPGDGPDDPAVRLSGFTRFRLELAVRRFHEGVAPFVVVSGGSVHPPRTPFNEALEMKRALIEDYRLPPNVVLVDPHARHTTTNIRNTARMLYRYGMPFAMPVLIVTDEYQADGIMEDDFDERNLRETGTLPYVTKKRVAPTEVEILPSMDSLQVGWKDPLDP